MNKSDIDELREALMASHLMNSSESLGSAGRTTPVEFLSEQEIVDSGRQTNKKKMLESIISNNPPNPPNPPTSDTLKSLPMMTKQPPQRIGSPNKRKSSDISELIDSDDSAMNTDDELETIQKTKKAKNKEGGKKRTRKRRKSRRRKRRKSRRRKRRRKKRTNRRR